MGWQAEGDTESLLNNKERVDRTKKRAH